MSGSWTLLHMALHIQNESFIPVYEYKFLRMVTVFVFWPEAEIGGTSGSWTRDLSRCEDKQR